MAIDLRTLKQKTPRIWETDDLPEEFSWLRDLSPLHYRMCLVEIHSAVDRAGESGDWAPVLQLVEEWKATAEVDSDPKMVELLSSASLEFEDIDAADLED